MIKEKLKFIENPLFWVVNIGAAVLSWKYWDGVKIGEGNLGNGALTIAALIVLTISSFWIYFRADKQVRNFLASQQKKTMLTTVTSLANIHADPIKSCLYAKSSEDKFQAAFALASVWTLAMLAIALTGPSDTTIPGAGVRIIPYAGLAVAAVVWVVIARVLFRTRQVARKDWFSLSHNPPKSKVPSGYVQDSVMCMSPAPLNNWGKKSFHVCKISDINGPNMPQKGDVRDRITWTYMKIPAKEQSTLKDL